MTQQVTNDVLTDGSVTAAKLAAGAAVSNIGASGITSNELAANAVTPAKLSQPLTQGTAVASTSGTSIDFTSIPSWAKRITVMFNGVSHSGTAALYIQLGTSGGVETTGYSGLGGHITNGNFTGSANVSSAFAIGMATYAANDTRSGSAVITNLSGNTWTMQGMVGIGSGTDTTTLTMGAGSKTLSGVLDRIRITTSNGADTFDAGSINILYE